MFFVYVLKSLSDEKFYIGYTADLKKRLGEHWSGRSLATKCRRPFTLVYYETYRNSKDAFARERFLKTGWGYNYLHRVLKNYLAEDK